MKRTTVAEKENPISTPDLNELRNEIEKGWNGPASKRKVNDIISAKTNAKPKIAQL
jgi:hypothetical protein